MRKGACLMMDPLTFKPLRVPAPGAWSSSVGRRLAPARAEGT
jgi:hypothetical protein